MTKQCVTDVRGALGRLISIGLALTALVGCGGRIDLPESRTSSLSRLATSAPTPSYPPEALAGSVGGSVVVDVRLGPSGDIVSTQVLESPAESLTAAVAAVLHHWRFEPLGEPARFLSGPVVFHFDVKSAEVTLLKGDDHVRKRGAFRATNPTEAARIAGPRPLVVEATAGGQVGRFGKHGRWLVSITDPEGTAPPNSLGTPIVFECRGVGSGQCETVAAALARRDYESLVVVVHEDSPTSLLGAKDRLRVARELLKAGHHEEFVRTIMSPDSVPEGDRGIEQFVESARKRGDFDRLNAAADAALRMEPWYFVGATGPMAVYEFDPSISGLASLGFVRHDGRWYMV